MRGTLLLLFISALFFPGPAFAQDGTQDLWSEPNPGVRYLHRTTDLPCTIHALVVDLASDGVRIEATPHEERWRAVGTWAREREMVAAINGGFWSSFARPNGIAVGDAEPWPDVEDDADHGFFAVDDSGRAWVSPPEAIEEEIPQDTEAAVSGRPMLVRDGEIDTISLDTFEHSRNRHPRTAVGVSRDGHTVYLVVADGRRAHSKGLNLYELSELLLELGAHDAINLDGGGSSTMYVEALGGVVNAPSGGRWEAALGLGPDDEIARERVARDGVRESYVRGVEREVMNHLGVVAPRLESERDRVGESDSLPRPDVGGDPHEPPRAPLFSLGTAREVVYPVLWAFGCAVPLLFAFAIWRRRHRV
jgi:uncharacterized protein YigE (DUF2233 family)